MIQNCAESPEAVFLASLSKLVLRWELIGSGIWIVVGFQSNHVLMYNCLFKSRLFTSRLMKYKLMTSSSSLNPSVLVWILSSVKFLCFLGWHITSLSGRPLVFGLTSAHVHFQIDLIYKCPIPKTDNSCFANSGTIDHGEKWQKIVDFKTVRSLNKKKGNFLKAGTKQGCWALPKLCSKANLFLQCVSFYCAWFSLSYLSSIMWLESLRCLTFRWKLLEHQSLIIGIVPFAIDLMPCDPVHFCYIAKT